MALPLTPFAFKFQQFSTNNGDPAVGYKIYSYTAGTDTPISFQTDVNGGSPAANPYVLDGNGRLSDTLFWPADTGIKVIYCDEDGPAVPVPIPVSGVTISTDDNIAPVAANALNSWGITTTAGQRDMVDQGQIISTDFLVTVLPAASPDPCEIFLEDLSTRLQDIVVINIGATVDVALTPAGSQRINGVLGPVTIPMGTTPIFSGIVLGPDPDNSTYWIKAFWS